MTEAEEDLECPGLRGHEFNVIGEFKAELAHELMVDVVETGEISDTQSGGVVVLRCKIGR